MSLLNDIYLRLIHSLILLLPILILYISSRYTPLTHHPPYTTLSNSRDTHSAEHHYGYLTYSS